MIRTREEVACHFENLFAEIMRTREDGQKEYAHDDSRAFANFEKLSEELGVSREQVLWIYAMKHKDGIVSYLKGHKSQRESVHGRIKDLIVYLMLLDGMITDNEMQAVTVPNREALTVLCLDQYPVETLGGKLTHQCTRGKGHPGPHSNLTLDWD